MARPNRIPLFPLEVVLLPEMPLPLHIFEPRYKEMIRLCMDEKLEFGTVLAANNAIATVGCTAEILRKVQDYPDGRMDILAEGCAVFRLTAVHEEKAYHEATVEYLEDTPSRLDGAQRNQLVNAFDECHAQLFGRRWARDDENDDANLAYQIAAILPLELAKKQALLEMRSEADRRQFILQWINAFLPKLLERRRARERAGGNGHALN
jgi:Lon protease-like protein